MIIDAHVHVGTEKSGFYSTKEMILRNMKENNIDKSIIFPLNSDEIKDCFYKSNDLIVKTCKDDERFIGFMRLDPNCNKKLLETTMETFYHLGLKGIKIHPNAQKFRIALNKLKCIITFAKEKKIPILCHTCKFDPLSRPEYLISIAKKNPDVVFIAAHGSDISKIAEATKKLNNFYVDTACITNHAHINFLTTFGNPERVLFGSDFPFSLPKIEKLKIICSNPCIGIPQKEGMPKSIKRMVLGTNAKKLFYND